MGDWGDIAGGFNQGMQQNVRTIGELQHMNLLKDKAEREKNVFESWKKQEEEGQRPIFLDNLPVKLGKNVQTKLEGIAETQGLINTTPDGRKFVRAKHGKELLALTNSPALLSEQMKDLTEKETELKGLLANTKKPEEAQGIQAELDKVLQGKDALSMQSKEFADMVEQKKRTAILEKEANRKEFKTLDQLKVEIGEGLKAGKTYDPALLELVGVKGKEKTIGNIQADVITKYLENQPLTPAEQKIKDKYFRGEKDTYEDTKLRWKAKVDAFETSIGRAASAEEKRRLFISDPYGILAPGEDEKAPPPPPGQTPQAGKYQHTATDAKGNKVGWDGKNWVDIKTGKVVK
jgi:hypothetical protein